MSEGAFEHYEVEDQEEKVLKNKPSQNSSPKIELLERLQFDKPKSMLDKAIGNEDTKEQAELENENKTKRIKQNIGRWKIGLFLWVLFLNF